MWYFVAFRKQQWAVVRCHRCRPRLSPAPWPHQQQAGHALYSRFPQLATLHPPPASSRRSLDQLDSLVTAEVAALAADGPSAEELQRYKKVGVGIVQTAAAGHGNSAAVRPVQLAVHHGRLMHAGKKCVSAHLAVPLQAARMELLDALGSNTALAGALATYQVGRHPPPAGSPPAGSVLEQNACQHCTCTLYAASHVWANHGTPRRSLRRSPATGAQC